MKPKRGLSQCGEWTLFIFAVVTARKSLAWGNALNDRMERKRKNKERNEHENLERYKGTGIFAMRREREGTFLYSAVSLLMWEWKEARACEYSIVGGKERSRALA